MQGDAPFPEGRCVSQCEQEGVFGVFQGLIGAGEGSHVDPPIAQAEPAQGALDRRPQPQILVNLAKQQFAAVGAQACRDLLQQAHAGKVDVQHPAQVQDDPGLPVDVRQHLFEQLIGLGEKQVAAQFVQHDAIAVAGQQRGLFGRPLSHRGALDGGRASVDDRQTALLADEQQDSDGQARQYRHHQVVADGDAGDQQGDRRVQTGAATAGPGHDIPLHQVERRGDDDAGQRAGRQPLAERAGEGQYRQQQQAGGQRGPAAGAGADGGGGAAHAGRAGHTPGQADDDLADALGQQFAAGVMAQAGGGVGQHRGQQGVERRQHRQGEGGMQDQRPGQGGPGRELIDGQVEFRQLGQGADDPVFRYGRRVGDVQDDLIEGGAAEQADDGAGNVRQVVRRVANGAERHHRGDHRQPGPLGPQAAVADAEQRFDLRQDQQQAGAGGQAGDDRVRDEFHQPPAAGQGDQQLEQSGAHGDGEQGRRDAVLREAGGGEQHRRAAQQGHAGAGRPADQAHRAATGAGDQQQADGAEQTGQRTRRGAEVGCEHGHPEGGGLR